MCVWVCMLCILSLNPDFFQPSFLAFIEFLLLFELQHVMLVFVGANGIFVVRSFYIGMRD